MRFRGAFCACALLILSLTASASFADGHGHGRHGDRDDDDRGEYRYSDRDRDVMRGWYHEHHGHLPPGLAKKDRLPPGWERKLVVHHVIDYQMREYMRPCPEELERRLPPPPPECEHTVIGTHIVLVYRRTNIVVDVFHLEL
jgi:hypothetical protein